MKLRTRQGLLLSHLLFNIIFEVFANTVQQEKDLKSIRIEKANTIFSFAEVITVYVEKIRFMHKILELEFKKVVGYKVHVFKEMNSFLINHKIY